MNWTSYKPIVYRDKLFGQKDVELMRFLDLPSRVSPTPIEISMPTVDSCSVGKVPVRTPQRMISETPLIVRTISFATTVGISRTQQRYVAIFHSYREYLVSSKAEWSVAKNGYVTGNVGWFSGRSACYLAAGRPVVVQDTGLSEHLPTGLGVLLFSNMDQATEGIRNVLGSYQKHAQAAFEIAEAYFDSRKVLTNLLGAIS